MKQLWSRYLSRRLVLRVLVLFAIFTAVASLSIWMWQPSPRHSSRPIVHSFDGKRPLGQSHPIDRLIHNARKKFDSIIAKRTTSLHAAAEAYRKRRGRHPPPGFDAWHMFAEAHDAVIIEDFFDQVYHDLNPFWGLPVKEIRNLAKQMKDKIRIKDGKVVDEKSERDWVKHWTDMVRKIQDMLPDMEFAINLMDEPRVIVPWEDISRYVQAEKESRRLLPPHEALKDFSSSNVYDDTTESVTVDFGHTKWYWDFARAGCSSNSPAREVPGEASYFGPPPSPVTLPSIAFEGYVSNWTAAKDPCLQPELRESHGSFVEPISQSTTKTLVPYFGGSKLPMNNDILIPAPMYWPEESPYSSGKKHGVEWEDKAAAVIWRGAASGGRNRAENWTRFQRHRFVSLMNGTQVRLAEQSREGREGPNFVLQPYETYRKTASRYMDLGTWLDLITDVGFTSLDCFPETGDRNCPHTDPYYKVLDGVSMEKQFSYKYLPDLDGNSFSGRYLSFLRSTSLPIKATIYSEWHDSRLIPWLHFVPMHSSFVDIYGILEYFLGFSLGVKTDEGQVVMEGGHDGEAKKIALAGKEWAEKVLRREDMLIYLLRVLLEYARICDDQRDRLGFVGDLERNGR